MAAMRTLETRIPPPVVLVAHGGIAWILARALPGGAFALPGRPAWALAAALGGLAVALAGVRECRRARTTVNPLRPEQASALVSSGPFRITRNPMYLGLVGVLLGWTLWLSNAWAFVAVPALMWFLARFQIQPEERALEARFGEVFRDYAARVRRWL
jgi:protein-S-isoprenylcysteine O-methyltransferase Ste14